MPVLICNPYVAFPFGTVAPLARAVSLRACFTAILFAAIFLQRFALPLGPNGVGFNLCVTLGALALLAWRGALVIDRAAPSPPAASPRWPGSPCC